jgi:hypothetical protein
MATLMSFILKTLQPRLNNSANQKLWLPMLLNNAKNDGNPLLPLTSDKQDMSAALQTDEGSDLGQTLAHDWGLDQLPQGEFGIQAPTNTDPPRPSCPALTMTSLVLKGLQNVKIHNYVDSQPIAGGYSVNLTLTLGSYTGTVNNIAMTPLILTGKWSAAQPVCSAPSPDATICDGKYSDTMIGSGKFKMTFSDIALRVAATVVVNGSGGQRTLSVNVISAKVASLIDPKEPTSSTRYVLSCVTLDQDVPYKDSVIQTYVEALEQPEAEIAVFAVLNNMLAQADTLNSLNQNLQNLANNILDDVFGAVPAGGLPDDAGSQKAATPVDLYIFDRVRTGVENPDSNIYAPLLVDTISDPVVEPWKKDLITIPTMDVDGLDTDVSLNNVVVTGISNIDFPIAQGLLQGSQIQALIRLAMLPAGPNRDVNQGGNTVNMAVPVAPPLTLECGFTYTLEGDDPINGNLTLGMTGLTGQVAIQPAGTEADTLSVTINSLVLDSSQVVVTVDDVKTDPDDGPTDALLRKFFESPKILKALTKAINNQLTGQLADISQDLSKSLRQVLLDQLGS